MQFAPRFLRRRLRFVSGAISPWRRAALLVGLGLALVGESRVVQAQEEINYTRDVRPLLARRCYSCHGPDLAEGGLRLHEHQAALAELDSGDHAIVAGNVEESALLARVASDDEGERMPPEGKPLTAREVEILRQWIAQGAKWETPWAYRAPEPSASPAVKRQNWVRSPIDAHILHKLEANGLAPAPPADKVTLIRRAYYDLTGLPPSPAAIEAFVADESPEAFAQVVDQLLASPQYGERWGRHWLDVVRYAETNSYERDGVKPHVWRYRDYVIRAFNEDKPYDEFIIEQLAGDELPNRSAESIIATGYYRLGLWDDEPADRDLARYDGLDDLVGTTSQVFLGLTVNCARCHDHKIDPIPQADYYSMLAFFHNTTPHGNGGPQIETPIFIDGDTPEKFAARQQAREAEIHKLETEFTRLEDEFRQKLREEEQGDVTEGSDLSDLTFSFYREHWDMLPDFAKFKPETEGPVPSQRFDLSLATRNDDFGFVFRGFLKVPVEGTYRFWLDSDDGSRLIVDGKEIVLYDGIHGLGAPREATIELKAGRTPIELQYFQRVGGLGLEVAWSGPGFERRLLSSAPEKNRMSTGEFRNLVRRRAATLFSPEWLKNYDTTLRTLDQRKRQQPKANYALSVTEYGPNPPDTFILVRGIPGLHGDKVEPSFPQVLTAEKPDIPKPAPDAKSTGRRLALARWIASDDNPLTARVMVNRVWQHHFGRGIVRSPNNFGGLGIPPTHPELLDYLASELVQGDWRLKPLHRQIMLSNAYQMSSQGNETALLKDPGNDLFWRFDMRRLSAEEIRDSIQAVNGKLNLQMYGPSYFAKISDEVKAGQSVPGKGWGDSPPDQQARRSIYIHVKRSLLTPLLADFDLPDPDASCEARFITTQPGQALGMLNGEFLHEQAAALADRLRREAGSETRDQVALALRLALCREPDEASIARGLKLIEAFQTEHGQTPEKALDYYCLMVLNLNEFIYLD